MTESFWYGGAKAYDAGLREHYGNLLQKLAQRRATIADETEKSAIDLEMTRLKNELHSKLEAADDMLF